MILRNLKSCFSKLITQPSSQNLHLTSLQSSIYFLEGMDPRRLSPEQQLQISKFVALNPDGDSFMVFNELEVERKIQNWYDKLPWIKPFYAMKANPMPALCKRIIESKLGMDCASKKEIEQSLELGINPKDIAYSNSIKNQEDLKWAYKNNIKLTLADTKHELMKVKELAPEMKILWRIAIQEEETDDLTFWGFAGKFGDDIKDQASIRKRMKQIKQMGVRLEGIHFHAGSTRSGSLGFQKGIQLARKCLQIGREYGHKMQLMDIGGGFPGVDLTDKFVEAFKSTHNDPLGYQIIAEPGRFLCDNMFYVCTRVIGQRRKNGVKCYHINDSKYHTFNTVMTEKTEFKGNNQFYGKVQNNRSFSITNNPENITLFGMTLDGSDIIGTNIQAPQRLKIGDWLVWGGLGAYSYAMKTGFNGMDAVSNNHIWRGEVQKKANDSGIILETN